MIKPNLSKALEDMEKIIHEIVTIKIELIKHANDPEKVRSLARQLEVLL